MRHEIASTVGATAGVTAEVAQDPTVGLSHLVLDDALSEDLPCCTVCGLPIMCIECGEDSANGFMLEADDPEPSMSHSQEEYEDDDDDMEDEDETPS